ncbi:RICIN domain-containing protein [Streptomyces sp. NPDC059874]|uniref:RICIN domain-containing protein n=1 Tax=Streptomyces sp. NPDC059874 TaxID=3346983 RepID=UPI0036493BE2
MHTTARRWAQAVAPLLICALALTATPAAAEDADQKTPRDKAAITSLQTFKNANTGECLDHSFQYGLRTITCYYNEWQTWNVWTNGPYVVLQNSSTGQCLYETWYGAPAATGCDWGNNDFQWLPIGVGSGGRIILTNRSTRSCLDDTRRSGLRVVTCENKLSHLWS